MRMREGLNVSEVMQAHSEYMPYLLDAPHKNQNGILESSRTQFCKKRFYLFERANKHKSGEGQGKEGKKKTSC